jgi:hypothetical protein
MNYLKKGFTVAAVPTEEYRKNFDAIDWGKPKEPPCTCDVGAIDVDASYCRRTSHRAAQGLPPYRD